MNKVEKILATGSTGLKSNTPSSFTVFSMSKYVCLGNGEMVPVGDVRYHSALAGDYAGAVDFRSIVGHYLARRTLEIAAAGGHNILIQGPPESGKTMLLYALALIVPDDLLLSPGWLVLDDLHNFPASFKDTLKDILDNRHVIFAGTMESGGDTNRPVKKGKLSRVLLNRLDIKTTLRKIPLSELVSDPGGVLYKKRENTAAVKKKVMFAREAQLFRFKNETHRNQRLIANGQMNNQQTLTHCILDKSSKDLLSLGVDKLGISAAGYYKILRISRTIADLEGCLKINELHIQEALQYYGRSFNN